MLEVADGEFTAPISGTVVAPGGHGTCTVGAVPGVEDAAPLVVVPFAAVPLVVVVEPTPLGVVVAAPVPVPVPGRRGAVVVPVPAPVGTQGSGVGVTVGVFGTVAGGVVAPGLDGAVVCGAVVLGGVCDGVVAFCAAMTMTDIADATANALESVISVRVIALNS